jgi:hypothetical protein
MADDEAVHSKPGAEPGFPPDLPHQTAVSGAGDQAHGETSAEAAEDESLASPADTVPPKAEEPISPEAPNPVAAENSLDSKEPELSNAPEPKSHEPEAASSYASWRVVEQAPPPRSRFPALAATAIAGGLLGFGGSLALRHFEGAPVQTVKSDDRLDAVSARLDAIDAKGEAPSPADLRTALAALETRVAAAESTANKATESAAAAQADLQKDIAARPAAPEAAPSAVSNSAEAPDLEPLAARIGAIEQKLTSLETTLAAPKSELRARAQDRETAPASKQGSRPQTLAIVAQSLLHKLESGSPFPEQLAALENLGVPAEAVAPLHAAASGAVPNDKQLAEQFSALVPEIIAADPVNQAGADEGFLDRVTRHAKGLVHIRRTGEAEDKDAEGIANRIEMALADHDLDAAYQLWKQLPGPSAAKSESWGEAVKARLDAINAAKSIEADAVTALGKPKS